MLFLLFFPFFIMTMSPGRHRMRVDGPDPIWSVDRPPPAFAENHNRGFQEDPDEIFGVSFDLHQPRRADHPRIPTLTPVTIETADAPGAVPPVHTVTAGSGQQRGRGSRGGRGRGRGGRGGTAQRPTAAVDVDGFTSVTEPAHVSSSFIPDITPRQRRQADENDSSSDDSSSSSGHDQGLPARSRAPKFTPGPAEINSIMFQLCTDVSTSSFLL